MILQANDFGCVPDGRFLERVVITAGSAVLTDEDGIFRSTDVGKHIAVPGAIDLGTTLARLVEHREVRNAKMGGPGLPANRLTGILFDPAKRAGEDEEPFIPSVHEGRRITVVGAGPNGETLVSDVTKVIDKTTIDLADTATTAVSGVRVVLNQPDRIALGDYARRTVEDLTIDLGDRVITDGKVTVGARGLTSETAKFSSLDHKKPVTIRQAGLLVTTIQSIDSDTQVTLAVPALHDVEQGLADVWKSDSREGLEKLLASLNDLEVESAEIQFGPGVYDFTRIPSNSKRPMNAAIGLQDLKNLTIRGAGSGVTILRLMPQQDLGKPNTHVIETIDCKHLTIRDLSIHGAYLTLVNTNEQMHGIQLNEGSEDVVVERVRVFQSAGDGIRLLGRPENPRVGRKENKVRRVWVDGCQFIQNKRTGVSFQRATELVWIVNCYIEMLPPSTDACIDFEPTGNSAPGLVFAAPTDIIIDSNLIRHGLRATAVSISGIGGPDPARRIKFSNNVLVGGDIFCTDVAELTVQNNVVLVNDLASGNRSPFAIQRGGDSIIITGNLFVNSDSATQNVILLSEVNQRQVTRAVVANNLCFARFGRGITCQSSDDVMIQGNMIVATGDCTKGILVDSQSSDADNISVRDNDIMAEGSGTWETGIQINSAANGKIHHVSVIGNSVRNAEEGIAFGGITFQQTPVVALNRIDFDVPSSLVGIGNLPEDSLVGGGAASRGSKTDNSGAGRLISGLGNPEGKVTGNVGDIFQRLDVPQPNEASLSNLYIKTAGNCTKTGWTAK